MSSHVHFLVTGRFDGRSQKRAYFVSDLRAARKSAIQDGASEVYRIKTVESDWVKQQLAGREYGMLLLRAINFQCDAGIPPSKAVLTAIDSETDSGMRARLQSAVDSLGRGESLADSLFATGLYDTTTHSILASGERIGGASAIKSAMDYLEEKKVTWKMYGVVISWVLMEVSSALSVPPAISDMVIPYIRAHLPKGTAEEMANYTSQLDSIEFNNLIWMWVSSAFFAAIAVLAVLWFINPRIKNWIAHTILSRIPLVGDWYANDALSRSCKVFAMMLRAGVRMPDAIETIYRSTKNSLAKEFWSKSLKALNTGLLPGNAFASSGILRKDEILVLNSARGNEQLAHAFSAMSEDRAWRKKVLGTRVFRMSILMMMIYIGITLLIGFRLFGLFSAGMDMTMDSTMKGM